MTSPHPLSLAVALLTAVPALGACTGIGLWCATANPFQ